MTDDLHLRADAPKNKDKILSAAEEIFRTQGADVVMSGLLVEGEAGRRPDVGLNAQAPALVPLRPEAR